MKKTGNSVSLQEAAATISGPATTNMTSAKFNENLQYDEMYDTEAKSLQAL